MVKSPVVSIAIVMLCFGGCGEQASPSRAPASRAAEPRDDSMTLAQAPEGRDELATAGNLASQAVNPPGNNDSTRLKRQIIYDSTLRLVVEDFADIPQRVEKLVQEAGGFVAHSNVQGLAGRPRRGTWKIRLPVADYSSFIERARTLGEVQSLTADSQDVSEQYYDLESRIRNKKKEEERLIKLLEESTGKLTDILQVEKELSRVREELERMQGRMRVLQDLVSLATVTLEINEEKGYVPPENPTFMARISRTFSRSWEALVVTLQVASVVVVALTPWVVALGIPGWGFVWLVRRAIGRAK